MGGWGNPLHHFLFYRYRPVWRPGFDLLKNAFQAVKEAGGIKIRTFEKDDQVYIQISDTGVGIPPAQLERLFDFYFHATQDRMKMRFGLSTDFRITQNHKGEIRIESEVRKGTEVAIRLPKREQG